MSLVYSWLPAVVVAKVDCVRLMFEKCSFPSTLSRWLHSPSPTVSIVFPRTIFEVPLVSYMLRRTTSRLNILERRTAHTRSPYNHRSGQKKSAVSGTSRALWNSHSLHINCCVRSTFGAASL